MRPLTVCAAGTFGCQSHPTRRPRRDVPICDTCYAKWFADELVPASQRPGISDVAGRGSSGV